VILLAMNNKTWLMEMEFLACAAVIATIALTLMVGNAIWKSMAGESAQQIMWHRVSPLEGMGLPKTKRPERFSHSDFLPSTIHSRRSTRNQPSTGRAVIIGNSSCTDCAKAGASGTFAGRMNFVRPVPDASFTFKASRSKRA